MILFHADFTRQTHKIFTCMSLSNIKISLDLLSHAYKALIFITIVWPGSALKPSQFKY